MMNISCVDIQSVNPPINPVVIGKIIGAYGVLGWSRIISFTDRCHNIFDYNPYFVIVKSTWKLIYLDKWRLLGRHYIVKIQGILNRDAAQELNQCDIIIDESQLPHLKNGEYYWKDLIGCKVISITGFFLGNVISIIETTANDVLVVKVHKNNLTDITNCLIPFIIKKVIKNVDLFMHTITVDWDIQF